MEVFNPKIKKLYISARNHFNNKDFDQACIELNKIIDIAKKKKLSLNELNFLNKKTSMLSMVLIRKFL